MCGELSSTHDLTAKQIGSSPRVRGTRDAAPAHAAVRPVHPRVCGELLDAVRQEIPLDRFIPACAGNSLLSAIAAARPDGSSPRVRGTRPDRPPPRGRAAVHPRVCGELEIAVGVNSPLGGSSPRVRGTRDRLALGDRLRRFIPACAGNSIVVFPALPTGTVHPRVCGELVKAAKRIYAGTGSSPRVRGTRRAAA